MYYKIIKAAKENKEWVLFLHGIGGNSRVFKNQLETFKNYNILLVDFRGHGDTKELMLHAECNPSFAIIADDILKLMDKLYIERLHIIGLSLGTMVAHEIALTAPERVLSMVLTGAIFKYRLRTKTLFFLGNMLKGILSPTFLYTFFAFMIMPKSNHKLSRDIFIRESKKMHTKELYVWFDVVQYYEKTHTLEMIRNISVPRNYIMGAEDHMFTPMIEKYIKRNETTEITIIKNCGHVASIDAAEEFNKYAINFINKNRSITNEDFISVIC